MRGFEMPPTKKPDENKIPVTELSDREVAELETADPKKVMREAETSVENLDKIAALVSKIYEKIGELTPPGADQKVVEAKKMKAMEILHSQEFQRKMKNALANQSPAFDEKRFVEAYARLALEKVKETRQ
ncbi:MAG TPA: hypothetical protein PLK35_02125 [Candidatus Moranbacteria bacterium]|nr:hypothetical protein [Candidatus Moranbacteria bacterium]